jgi:mono/diheme cytochrome c family protein
MKRNPVAFTLMVPGMYASALAQLPAGPFTAAQSAAGQTTYQTSCSRCHAAKGFAASQQSSETILRDIVVLADNRQVILRMGLSGA